jgi:hypothetical protein
MYEFEFESIYLKYVKNSHKPSDIRELARVTLDRYGICLARNKDKPASMSYRKKRKHSESQYPSTHDINTKKTQY